MKHSDDYWKETEQKMRGGQRRKKRSE